MAKVCRNEWANSLTDACQLQVAGHAVADLPGTERQAAFAGHGGWERHRTPPRSGAAATAGGLWRHQGEIDHAIHMAFTAFRCPWMKSIAAQGRLLTSLHPEAAAQHHQKHGAVPEGINHPKNVTTSSSPIGRADPAARECDAAGGEWATARWCPGRVGS